MRALRRVVYRALIVGVGELVLVAALLPSSPVASMLLGYPIFAAFLAIPAALVTLVEVFAARFAPGRQRALATGVAAWLVAVLGALVAHLQALYAGAVLEVRSVEQGLAHVEEGWTRLADPSDGAAFLHFAALGVPFALATVLSLDRVRPRMRLFAIAGSTLFVALSQDAPRAIWGSRVFEEAAVLVSLSVPVFFALADRLAERGAQSEDEQNAR